MEQERRKKGKEDRGRKELERTGERGGKGSYCEEKTPEAQI